MRLRVQTDSFTTLLLAALGIAPIGACGGAFATNGSGGGDSGSGGQAGVGVAGDDGGSFSGGAAGVYTGAGGVEYGTGGGVVGVGGYIAGGFDGGPGTGGSGPTNRFPCVSVLSDSGAMSVGGYQRCSNGVVHRASKDVCPNSLPRNTVFAVDGGLPDAGNYCQRDADCVAAHGYCGYVDSLGGPVSLGPRCSYGCVRDEECTGMNQICVCGNPVGHCEAATCSVDSQCGPGFLCASYVTNPGCPGESFACQSPTDQCATDADCGARSLHVPTGTPYVLGHNVRGRTAVLGGWIGARGSTQRW